MRVEAVSGNNPSTDGSLVALRVGRGSDLITSELHGKYYEQARRGNVFTATMTAGVIFPAPASTASNVMTLANPLGSTVNLSIISFEMLFTILPGTPVTGTYQLGASIVPQGAAVTGTAIVPFAMPLGSQAQPQGRALSTSTIPAAATIIKALGQKVTGELAAAAPMTPYPGLHFADFDGSLVVGPGAALTPQMTAADTTNATVICSFTWEEIPI